MQRIGTTTQATGSMLLQGPEITAQGPEMTTQGPETTARSSGRDYRLRTYTTKASVDQRLVAARITIDAVLADNALQEVLAPYGYDHTELLRGQALREQAQSLNLQRGARVGEQAAATHARDTARAQAHASYMRHLRLARVALRDEPAMTQALDLRARKRTAIGWLAQARRFYANLLADAAIVEKLAARGVTYAALIAAQGQVEVVETQLVQREHRRSLAREATHARDTAVRALDVWMRDFLAIARVALADQPQMFDRLGA